MILHNINVIYRAWHKNVPSEKLSYFDSGKKGILTPIRDRKEDLIEVIEHILCEFSHNWDHTAKVCSSNFDLQFLKSRNFDKSCFNHSSNLISKLNFDEKCAL